MRLRSKIILIGALVVIIAVITWRVMQAPNDAGAPVYVDSTLAIRGFRHGPIEVAPGESKTYEVEVGEEFKVVWKTVNLTEKGQLMYRGPSGVGTGLVDVPVAVSSSSETGNQFLTFTAREAGTAEFTLTVTGPGPDGVYTVPSTIIVDIKKF